MRFPLSARLGVVPLALTLLVLAPAAACSGDDGSTAPGRTSSEDEQSTSSSEAAGFTSVASDGSTTTVGETAPELVLRGDGLGVVNLGAEPDAAVAAVVAALGEPTVDTGWDSSFGAYGTCPGESIRAVEWDHLVLLFTDGDTIHGSGPHLFAWRLTGSPPPVATALGFGYRATAADASELYPDAVSHVPAQDPFPAFLEIEVDGGPIVAFLDEADRVTNLEAGAPCGE